MIQILEFILFRSCNLSYNRRMKKIILISIFTFLSLFITQNLYAEAGPGFQLGNPTGFNYKNWFDNHRAFDVGLSYSFDHFFLIYSDYLFHWTLDKISQGQKDPFWGYIGVGGALFVSTYNARKDDKDTTLGVRIPFGIEKKLPNTEVALFFELVPGIGIVPSSFMFFQWALGARIYLW